MFASLSSIYFMHPRFNLILIINSSYDLFASYFEFYLLYTASNFEFYLIHLIAIQNSIFLIYWLFVSAQTQRKFDLSEFDLADGRINNVPPATTHIGTKVQCVCSASSYSVHY